MAGLTAKQRAFVDEYLIDMNATQAAIRAGYSTKTASRTGAENLSKPVIAQAIAAAQARRAEKTSRTALDVLKDIQDVSRQARDEGDLKTALRGLELEGKHLGMFDKQTTPVEPTNVQIIIKERGSAC
ncbi:MAG: terminase small subunit [Desulfovibrionaceae bacterium]|nr:terminase small subunit [Desulfovibrionaceae bacterium]